MPGTDSLTKAESVKESATRIRGVIAGEKGVARDMVVANSAAGIFLAGAAASLADAASVAAEAIDSGKAAEKLEILSAEVAIAA
ncbi:MAG: Anthranilate phosphoribosyltransferase [Acidobacteria bacterium OLB17]|nr:MAG: Anthranilate phosphoribosyltransferase [Acidobacteria bacterium OLB17]